MFFLVKGACGYVLPRYENKVYLHIQEGKSFGHVELAADHRLMDEDYTLSIMRRSQISFDLIRRFTVQSFFLCDVLALSIADLLNMRLEFEKVFKELFRTAKERLRRELILKIEAIKNFERLAVSQEANGTDKFKAMFAYAFLGGILKKLKDGNEGVESIPLDELSLQAA